MVQAGAALARDDDAARAAAAAATAALAASGADRADAALVFASGFLGAGARQAAAAAAEALGAAAIAGASAHGVLAGGAEEEERPAVAVLALAGLAATPFRLPDLAGAEDAAGAELEAVLGGNARDGDLVVLLADPAALDMPRLLGALDGVLPPCSVVGAGAGPGGRSSLVWSGRTPVAEGASGLVLHLERPAQILVSHGCRPITGPLEVTRVEGRWLLEIEGRPALLAYREAAGDLLGADLRRAGELVVVAMPRGEDFVVRPVAGFSPGRGSLAVAAELRAGAVVRFALRDADLAREDLRRSLAGAGPPASAALYLSCPGRGQSLFRHAGLEAAVVADALGATPLGGMFGAFQLGPVAAATELHTYAAVLALLS